MNSSPLKFEVTKVAVVGPKRVVTLSPVIEPTSDPLNSQQNRLTLTLSNIDLFSEFQPAAILILSFS